MKRGREDSEGTIKSEEMENKEGRSYLRIFSIVHARRSVANEESNFPDDVEKVHGRSTILMRRQAKTYDNLLRERR